MYRFIFPNSFSGQGVERFGQQEMGGRHVPRIAKTVAGFTSLVCLLVRVFHRWFSATCNGQYEVPVLIFFGASFGAERSLSSHKRSAGRPEETRKVGTLTGRCNRGSVDRRKCTQEPHRYPPHRTVYRTVDKLRSRGSKVNGYPEAHSG